MKAGTPVSVVIITRNEAKNIARCIESVRALAAEVIVVDSFSADDTVAIAESLGARVVQRTWEGFSATKNYANSLAAGDWILSLDADEALSPELADDIRRRLTVGLQKGIAYRFARRTWYCGRWIRGGGWYPDYKTRLFDRRQYRWHGDFVHETLRADMPGAIETLRGDCYHYTHESLAHHIQTINRYSELRADEMLAKGKRARLWQLILKPAWAFWQTWLIKGGFLDGYAGFQIAAVTAFARFLRYAKLYERQIKARSADKAT